MAVEIGFEIRVGENEIFGDVAQFDIVCKECQVRFFVARRHGKVRAAEKRAGGEEAEIATYIGQLAPIDQRAAQDDVRCQILHDDQRLRLVEEENLRHHTGSTRSLAHQRVVFEEGAFQRQRPALADKANIGQGLLDDRRAFAARDDEHEVEVPSPISLTVQYETSPPIFSPRAELPPSRCGNDSALSASKTCLSISSSSCGWRGLHRPPPWHS